MARRQAKNVTGIRGTGQVDATVVWRVFGCSRAGCQAVLRISEDEITRSGTEVQLTCETCEQVNHHTHMSRGHPYKFCRVCEQLQPLENYDRHKPNSGSFRSGRQLECKSCKRLINARLNPLRTRDQHREASDRRRLYGLLAGEQKIDLDAVVERFGGRCFNCGEDAADFRLDHTLAALFLWPASFGPTLLCGDCNGNKAERWPSEFYVRDGQIDRAKLQRLSFLTGIPYELLAGAPHFNPDAVARLLANVDEFLIRWIRYPDEIKKLRRKLRDVAGIDIFEHASKIPDFLADE
jgi:hypothetical protein